MNYNCAEIAQRIRSERKKIGMSQESLCAEINVSRNTLSSYEGGKDLQILNMSIETLVKMCRVFKCDVGYLLGEYKERRQTASDICAAMGITENAANKLLALYGKNPDYEFSDKERDITLHDISQTISYLVESDHFSGFLAAAWDCITYVWDCIIYRANNKPRTEHLTDENGQSLKNEINSAHNHAMATMEKSLREITVFYLQRAAADIAEDIIQRTQREVENG